MSGMRGDKKKKPVSIKLGQGRQDINNQSSHDDYIMAEHTVSPAIQLKEVTEGLRVTVPQNTPQHKP